MLSWLRKKSAPPARTFNERTRLFWQWYAEVAPRFYATIEAGKCEALAPEVSAKLDELLPHFAWVFGPGAEGVGHSFTLSGEGLLPKQLLAQHWHKLAPAIDGWTFYPYRQAGPIKGQKITVEDTCFDPAEIWITPVVDAENEKVDITAWHPAWKGKERHDCLRVLFLFLDEALGEYGTDQYIGTMEIGDSQLAQALPLEELADFVGKTKAEHGWQKFPPGEAGCLAEFKEQGDFPRGDTWIMSTVAFPLVREFFQAEGELPDPVPGTGADFIYLSIDLAYFPQGDELSTRGRIEDAVDGALSAAQSGRALGGSFGRERSYLDFLIFDGERSLQIIKNTLRPFGLPAGTMIEYLAREKRGQRIAL